MREWERNLPLTARLNLSLCLSFSAVITRIYYADHTYTTLKYSMSTPAARIKEVAAEKLQIREPLDRLLLVEVKSSGERIAFPDKEISIGTGISVNGRIFISLRDHLDALTPLPEQEGPRHSSFAVIDEFSSLDLAYHLTHYAWSLFSNIHEVRALLASLASAKQQRHCYASCLCLPVFPAPVSLPESASANPISLCSYYCVR